MALSSACDSSAVVCHPPPVAVEPRRTVLALQPGLRLAGAFVRRVRGGHAVAQGAAGAGAGDREPGCDASRPGDVLLGGDARREAAAGREREGAARHDKTESAVAGKNSGGGVPA